MSNRAGNELNMRVVQYGSKIIAYSIEERAELKSHYISVEKHTGVVLKGKVMAGDIADRMVLKKAKWILDKLEVVKGVSKEVVTGSRMLYLGKSYYVQVVVEGNVEGVEVVFHHSKFVIRVKNVDVSQEEIEVAVELPFSLIDYLIVHELVHTVVKNHSRAFWVKLGRYEKRWKELDGRMRGMRM